MHEVEDERRRIQSKMDDGTCPAEPSGVDPPGLDWTREVPGPGQSSPSASSPLT